MKYPEHMNKAYRDKETGDVVEVIGRTPRGYTIRKLEPVYQDIPADEFRARFEPVEGE